MRIAASTYLNSAPLVDSFAQGDLGDRYEFLGDAAPARCAALLAAGEADIALIPVIEYQRIPELRIIPHVAVAAKQAVRSVLLLARKPLSEIATLALDTSSRTSQVLVQLILQKRYGCNPQIATQTPDAAQGFANMLTGVDAALVIGDPALRLAVNADQLGCQVYDLAEEWQLLTGLPFVFAVWAVRAPGGLVAPAITQDFLAAKAAGLARLPELAVRYAASLQLPEAMLLRYLRENVNYDLDEANLAGLQRYFAMAHESGLLAANRPLRMLG